MVDHSPPDHIIQKYYEQVKRMLHLEIQGYADKYASTTRQADSEEAMHEAIWQAMQENNFEPYDIDKMYQGSNMPWLEDLRGSCGKVNLSKLVCKAVVGLSWCRRNNLPYHVSPAADGDGEDNGPATIQTSDSASQTFANAWNTVADADADADANAQDRPASTW